VKPLIVLTLLLISCAAGAQVHRCTDAAGKVTYTDGVCPAATKATQIEAQKSSPEIELERERAALARERFELRQQREAVERERAPKPMVAPPVARFDSYACDMAKRNLGIGANKDSKARSQRQYEVACFGEEAAEIEKARAGATRINITPPPVIINRY
jgi:hypothetical protein